MGPWKRLLPEPLRRTIRRRLDREAATVADLKACYRLLLDREPDVEGWRTYAEALEGGLARRDLVFSFVSSPEFRKRHHLAPAAAVEPRLARIGDLEIYVGRPESPVGRSLLEQGRYEPHVVAALKAALPTGGVLVDVGANIGALSLIAARHVGESGRVFAFEPDPLSAALIELSARRNGLENVSVFPHPVADRAGTLLYEDAGGNGIVRPLEKVGDLAGGRVVRAVVLDEVLAADQRVDVIKLDVEGAEPLALAGATGLLDREHPVVLTELAPAALVEAGTKPSAFLEMLTGRGYELSILEASGPETAFGAKGEALLEELDRRRVGHLDIVARAGSSVP